MNRIDALNYEVRSSWLAPLVSIGWMQELLGSYYAWKVRRKWRRYEASLSDRKFVEQMTPYR